MTTQIIDMDSKDFQPRGENILVKGEKVLEEKKIGSLIIPIKKESVMDERPTSGIIVSKGGESEFEINDFVFWPVQDGIDFEFNDGVFLLLRDKSIIGKKK